MQGLVGLLPTQVRRSDACLCGYTVAAATAVAARQTISAKHMYIISIAIVLIIVTIITDIQPSGQPFVLATASGGG